MGAEYNKFDMREFSLATFWRAMKKFVFTRIEYNVDRTVKYGPLYWRWSKFPRESVA